MKRHGKHQAPRKVRSCGRFGEVLRSYGAGWRERICAWQFWVWLFLGALLMLPLGIFPMYTVYLKNTDSLTLASILGPMTSMVICYLAAYLVLALVTARPSMSALLGGIAMCFFMNFGKISGVFGGFLPTGLAMVFSLLLGLAVIAGAGFLLFKLRNEKQILRFFSVMLTIMFTGILVMNSMSVRTEIRKDLAALRADSEPAQVGDSIDAEQAALEAAEAAALAEAEAAAAAAAAEEERRLAQEQLLKENLSYGMPNIYFLVVDEMGGFAEMEKYYDYDLTEFKAFCDANNINYSSTSHTMYTFTRYCITDLCYYTDNYTTDNGTVNGTLNEHTLLNQALTDLGFSLYNMSTSTYTFQGVPPLLNSLALASEYTTEDGLSAEDIAYENSILQVLINARKPYESTAGEGLLTSEEILNSSEFTAHLGPDYKPKVRQILSVFDYFEDPESYIPNAGIALFSYFKSTHVPMLFQADGSIITERTDHRNWRDLDVYAGTYTYTLRHLEVIMNTILENDPDSIVVIMADHGVRYHDDTTLSHEVVIEEEYEKNIFNLLYYRGHQLDIEGLSATDTVRVVLNLLGKELPLQGEKTMDDVILYE